MLNFEIRALNTIKNFTSILVNNQPVTEFNGKEVVIETYIAKDLTNVSVKYNGAGDQPIATDNSAATDKTVAAELDSSSLATALGYNKETGLLRFKTNHFSEYYVLATVEALNVNTGVPYTSLAIAIADAKDGQEVKVMKDVNITSSPIIVNKNLVLDLNGNNITGTGTRIFNVTAGTLELSGTGILSSSNIADNSSVIRVGSNENSTPSKAGLIVGQSVKISGPNSYGVTVFGSTTQETIVINGTITSYSGAVSGNGSSGYGGTTIIINEGASLSATNASGIYHPQSGDLIINGGSISGTTGIEIKSGNASVSVNGNPTIKATGEIDHTASSNGNSSSGYSIAVVENKDYAGNASIVIESGTFIGPVKLLKDSESTTTYDIQIKGGLFSVNPTDYVAEKYYAEQQISGKYEVKKATNWIQVADTSWYCDHKNCSHSEADKNTYIITNSYQLAGLAKLVNNGNNFSGKTVKLVNDIELEELEWTPIGISGKPFNGTFDGNSKIISNLFVDGTIDNNSTNNYHGLFGNLNSPAIIKNFTLNNAEVKGSLYVGAVAGMAYTGIEISNVTVQGDVKISGWWYVGGIAGNGYIKTVKECTVNADPGSYVSGTGSYIGGIFGFRGEGDQKIESCVSNINVTGYSYVGGISGMLHYGNTIDNCTSSGTVTKTAPGDTTDLSDLYGIGGIAGIYVGHDTDLASIKDSNFYGELITNSDIVNGGIIGHSRDGDEADNLRIENCNYKGTNVNVNIPTSTT